MLSLDRDQAGVESLTRHDKRKGKVVGVSNGVMEWWGRGGAKWVSLGSRRALDRNIEEEEKVN